MKLKDVELGKWYSHDSRDCWVANGFFGRTSQGWVVYLLSTGELFSTTTGYNLTCQCDVRPANELEEVMLDCKTIQRLR